MTYITKKYTFCAAHRYWNEKWDEERNYQAFGDDIKNHGHNYTLSITIKGPINQDTGFIICLKKPLISKWNIFINVFINIYNTIIFIL